MEQEKQIKYVSPLAIDLGAMNTGVVLAHGKINDAPHTYARRGLTLVFPETGLELSQKKRLAKRHQRRGFKRRRLAKRLLQLILKQSYKSSEEASFSDFQRLRTFLNRRGYTYLTLEEAQDTVEEIRAMDQDTRLAIIEAIGTNSGLSANRDFLPQLEKTDQKPLEFYRTLLKACENAISKEKKDVGKDLKKKIRNIQQYCSGIIKAEQEGHRTRSEYLRNIREDLQQPEYASLASKFGLNSAQLANLTGHIANLQLRVLRRYFNDPKMAAADFWDEKRMERIFVRYLKSWHVRKSDTEYSNRQQMIEYCQKNGLYRAFTETNPELTIPPFEDQNNRRPPTCTSLHLDEARLDQRYPEWRTWTKKLLEPRQNLYELPQGGADSEVQWISAYYAKSARATQHGLSKSEDAIMLQRLLDRSAAIDDYRFRVLVQVEHMVGAGEPPAEGLKRAYETGKKELVDALGTDAADRFIELARRYYAETAQAKRGLWLPGENDNLLFRCDRKPRQKKNLKEELIGHILGTDLRADGLWQKWENLYFAARTIHGRSSVASICKNLEEARKNLGDEFHFYWNRIQRKTFKPNPADKLEKEVLKHIETARKAAELIAAALQHTPEAAARYANPYSLAQLYNLMEGDVAGFHSTCPACTRENFWRSSPAAVAVADADGQTTARASRLTADTMRPFDGFLARYLDRLGEKIAREKWKQLQSVEKADSVLVPILLEQNRFRFGSDLAEIKQSERRKQAREKLERAEQREHDRWERIRKAGHGICPYTGERVGSHGEFDHILPRSYSRARFGTVFNSEMNLVYASPQGNREKSDRRYTLKDLNKNYLQKVFGTADIDAIRKQIKQTLAKHAKPNSVYFHALDSDEQRDFRHALFDDELTVRVQSLLQTQYKMRVSGLQGYLARVIYAKLRELNTKQQLPLHFTVFGYDAGEPTLSARRENLAVHNAAYAKPREARQAPGSHVIDATMVWAQALERGDIPGLPTGLLLEGDALEELLPNSMEIFSLESRKQYRRKRPQTMQLFKDTIYAERYLALIVGAKDCGFGFDLKNMARFDYQHLSWVFELLKPFCAFRGGLVTEPLDHYLAQVGKKKKFIYFNIVREKAAEFQQKLAYAPSLTPVQQNQMNLLVGVRYFTIKKEIFGAMSDAQGKATAIFKEPKDREKFSVKVNFSLTPEGQKSIRIGDRVSLPHVNAWELLSKDKTVSAFTKEGMRWQELSSSDRATLIDRHFPKTIAHPLKHHSVRKVYSLPVPEGPSGGFRVKRRRTVRQFHVQAIEGAKFSGFTLKNGQVDFSAPTIMPALTKPDSLAPTDGYVGQPPANWVFMDEWREIPLTDFPATWQGVEKLWLQPNSEPRMRVRLQIVNTLIAQGMTAWHLVAPLAISTGKKPEDKRLLSIQQRLVALLDRIGLKPRDKVYLVSANDESTVYEFIVQGTNSEMKAWYNLGK
ncbi:MAG: hypothetical protein OHK0011_21400 [Turneriella sp.]